MALYALIVDGRVHDLNEAEDHWPAGLFDVRDVSGVPDVDRGWIAKGDGSYSAPEAVTPPTIDPVVPGFATKLGLKRALSETGDQAVFSSPQWQAVKDLLSKDADLQEEWDLAIEVKASDPIVQGAVKALKWKPAQVTALIVRANELVA